jgi:hypothetical protein
MNTVTEDKKKPTPAKKANSKGRNRISHIICQVMPAPVIRDNITVSATPIKSWGKPIMEEAIGRISDFMLKFLTRDASATTAFAVPVTPSLMAIQGAKPHKNHVT